MRTIAFLLLAACAVRAQDSLVERLETELRTLVSRVDVAADDATVSLVIRGDSRDNIAAGALMLWRLPAVRAILVGTPPRVVAPYSAVGDAEIMDARLANGRTTTATRWGGDADLGVVVYRLTDEATKGLKGVDVEGDWERLGVGSIAVAMDGGGLRGPRLGLVTASDARLGTIDVPGDGAAVFGSKGTLLGLRGGADMTACLPCHQTGDGGGVYSALQRSLSSYNLANAAAKSLQEKQANVSAFSKSYYDSSFRSNTARGDTDHLVAGPVIRRVLDDLEKHGAIQLSYLGVVTGDAAVGTGARIVTVVPDSPAAAAGLVPNVKILAIDGLTCPSSAFFSRVLVLHRPGDEVTLSVMLRDGDARPTLFKVRLGERAAAKNNVATAASIGLTCVELSPDLRRFLGFGADLRGVVVQEVAPRTPAADAGIRKGDVIAAGGGPITNLEELDAALAGAQGTIELTGIRIDPSGKVGTRYVVALPESVSGK